MEGSSAARGSAEAEQGQPLAPAQGAAAAAAVKDDLLLVGNKAPDFEAEAVFNPEFIKVKPSDYIGKKYVILFFYPLDFTFACPTEITAFSNRYEEFEKINTEILGVSIDSVEAVVELLGPEDSKHIVVEHTKDGSGIGAALLAAANSKYAAQLSM